MENKRLRKILILISIMLCIGGWLDMGFFNSFIPLHSSNVWVEEIIKSIFRQLGPSLYIISFFIMFIIGAMEFKEEN